MATFHPFGAQTYNLSGSISSTATSIVLSSFLEPVTGTPYTMALLNTDIAYGTIAPKTTSSEFISFTGITQNVNGTATLTGVTRGLAKKYPFTTDSAYKLPHSGQTQFIISDLPQLFEEYSVIENAETITGKKTFPGGGDAAAPVSGTVYVAPTNDLEYASKKFVVDTATGTTQVNGIIISGLAGENLTQGYVVYQKTSDGKWYKSLANDTTTFIQQELAIVQNTVSSGASVNLLIRGIDTHQLALVSGTAYYITDAGGLPSATPGTNTVFVGYGTNTATNLLVDFRSIDIPYHGEKQALVGSSGTPSSSNKYITENDVSAAAGSGKIVRASGTALPALDGSALTNITNPDDNITITAGENLTAQYPVGYIRSYMVGAYNIAGTGYQFGRITANNVKIGISFIPGDTFYLKTIEVYLKKASAPVDNVLIQLQTDSAGTPSGSVVDTITLSGAGLTTSYTYQKLSFTGTNKLTAATRYWLVFTRSGAGDDTNYYLAAENVKATAALLPSGTGSIFTTAWGAGSTTPNVGVTLFGVSPSVFISNPTPVASSNTTDNVRQFFLGFATASITSGNTGNVKTSGIVSGFTSLTTGENYYVQDGAGTMGTTPTSIYVGKAVSATQINIIKNPLLGPVIYYSDGGTAGSSGVFFAYEQMNISYFGAASTAQTLTANIGVTSSPTTAIVLAQQASSASSQVSASFTVAAGEYWSVTGGAGTTGISGRQLIKS